MRKKSKIRRFLTWVGSVRLARIWEKLQKPFNFCWKAGLVLFAVVLVMEIGRAVYETCCNHLGLTYYYWQDEDLGDGIEIRYFSNNQCAAYERVTGKRMSPKVRWISCVPERDSLTVFCDKEGRRGFLNVNTGKVEIEAQYSHAWHFSEGLAAVVAENGKVGFINYDNEFVIPPKFAYVPEHVYIFNRGICLISDASTELYGAIDTLGNQRLPMEYTAIFKEYEEDTWYLRKENRCGLADKDMNIIFDTVYDNIDAYSYDGDAYLTRDGIKQLVSFDGDVLLPFVIDDSWPLKYMVKYSESDEDEYELHPYLVEFRIAPDCSGVMDGRTGKVIVPALYSDIDMISKDLIIAEVKGSCNHAIFTSDGRMVQ